MDCGSTVPHTSCHRNRDGANAWHCHLVLSSLSRLRHRSWWCHVMQVLVMTGRNAEWLACRAKRCRKNPQQAAKVCLVPLRLTTHSGNPHLRPVTYCSRAENEFRHQISVRSFARTLRVESCPIDPHSTKKPGDFRTVTPDFSPGDNKLRRRPHNLMALSAPAFGFRRYPLPVLFLCGAMCGLCCDLHGKLFKEAHCAVKSAVVLVSLRLR